MNIDAPITVFDRRSGKIETEQVYGEGWLKWTYGTSCGRLSLAALVRRAWFSHWYGWRMNRASSVRKVLPFVVRYGLDADEFTKPATAFRTFNDFFYRTLKPAARPIVQDEAVAVLPADGRHLAFQDVDAASGFYVKGAKFTLTELLGTDELGAEFAGGSLLISRLCPVDYHRFHFPVAGVPHEARLINGSLYSVSPIALRRNVRYLVQNKRMVTLVESVRFGRIAVLEIGATCVGSILQSYVPGRMVAKGEEKGLFAFGGSCVVTVFAKGRIRFDADLVSSSADQREVYARMGESLGRAAD
ncbi:phosphatidylserine decarboxylase [Verrucomicrobia bacterium IMCC26134]|nr:phosphatidylserine decarboxylase [Verrucomicrobia bacterium IMCC26134]